jgi:hypothetical protein
MKLKKVLLGITGALALTFALTACGDEGTKTDTDPKQANTGSDNGEATPSSSVNYLTFMGDKKLRVDIMNDLGATFNYGNEAIQSKKETTLDTTIKLTVSGEFTVETVNFIIVFDDTTGGSVNVHKGLDAERVGEFLSGYPMKGNKMYIAISSGEATWTKGLNEKMDTTITTYVK